MENIETLKKQIEQMEPWFHNLHLPRGIQTAPNHFLGDFPQRKWEEIEPHLPKDLSGWKCLDIGCNAGFYSFELAKRGAKVLGIDSEPHYLAQARWATEHIELQQTPVFRQMQVHDLARLNEDFDLVLFMGVFYHLRYPQLALDTVARKTKKLMIFQTLTMNEKPQKVSVFEPAEDYPIMERQVFRKPGWPKMAFIEKSFSNDPTNWWVPNHPAVLAMLRSTGFQKIQTIGHEIYFCTPPLGGVEAQRSWDENEWLAATGQIDFENGAESLGKNQNKKGVL